VQTAGSGHAEPRGLVREMQREVNQLFRERREVDVVVVVVVVDGKLSNEGGEASACFKNKNNNPEKGKSRTSFSSLCFCLGEFLVFVSK